MSFTAHTASATCETCNTLFTDLPFERDEDGGYAVLEVTVCCDPTCGAVLCPACSVFQCDSCADTFCSDHAVTVEDGTPKPLKCCKACSADFAAQEPALCCPECLGTELSAVYPDGYEMFRCRSCGHMGDPGELVPEPAIERKGAGRAAAAVPAVAMPNEAA